MSFVIKFRTALIPYLPLVMRLGLGFVFLWSGLSKLGADTNALGVCTNAAEAVSLVESFTWLPIEPELFVLVQSWLEVALGLMLMLGLWVELAAFVSAVLFLLFFALLDFSYVWKNVGLLALALATFAAAPDKWRLDIRFKVGGSGKVAA